MIKRFLSVLLVLCAWVGYGIENYEAIVLGDLHYDAENIRADVDKLSSGRRQEMRRNLAAWKKNIPEMLDAAAEYSARPEVLFTVQCGDLTQGDEGKYKFARRSFRRALERLNKGQKKTVYVVRGNHDIRGKGKLRACDKVLGAYMQKRDVVFPLPEKDQTCYKIVDQDLFIFFDCMRGSLEAVEAAINAKPDARHIFFFTHIPIMPCTFTSSIIWIYGRNSETGDKLRSLLAKHNVIIFAAHTHISAYHKWKMPEGVIRQFVSFSLVTDPDAEISVKRFNGNEYLRSVERTGYEQLDGEDYADLLKFTKKFHGKLKYAIRYRGAAGFNVLRVEGEKVFIDIYSGSWDKPVYTQAIK